MTRGQRVLLWVVGILGTLWAVVWLVGPFVEIPMTAFSPLWWLDPLTQLLTTVLSVAAAAGILVWQLNRQHSSALEQQRSQLREQLHLEIHRDIADRLTRAGDSLGTFHITCMTLVSDLRLRREFLDQHGRQILRGSSYTAERLISENSAASSGLISVLRILEDYEIAFAGFERIRQRIGEGMQDLAAAYRDFYDMVLPFLTIVLSEEEARARDLARVQEREPPPADRIPVIQEAFERVNAAAFDLLSFLFDVRVEAQNHLLGGIFPRRQVPERRPQDPRLEVLRRALESSRQR